MPPQAATSTAAAPTTSSLRSAPPSDFATPRGAEVVDRTGTGTRKVTVGPWRAHRRLTVGLTCRGSAGASITDRRATSFLTVAGCHANAFYTSAATFSRADTRLTVHAAPGTAWHLIIWLG